MRYQYCRRCGKELGKGRRDKQFCSAACVAAYYRENGAPDYIHAEKPPVNDHTCEWCNTTYQTNDYAERSGKRAPKYCSVKCKQAAYRARGKMNQQQAQRRNEKKQAPPPPPPPKQKTYRSKTDEARDILGVTFGATARDIKQAYMKLIKKWHPDVCKEPNATEMSQRINWAYNYLKVTV